MSPTVDDVSRATIDDVVTAGPVLPVVVIDNAAHAVPLARALLAGGLKTLEVTLRTAAALDSLRAIADQVPEVMVGAGTALHPRDLDAVRRAGARFAVSPGATPELLRAAHDEGLPILPGVMTPSDVMAALALGHTVLKFFPAGPAGGPALLKAFAGPFPQVRFCPTGGIDLVAAAGYLALPNVCCVGGSWIAPADAVRGGDWPGIEERARRANSLRSCGTVAA